MLARLDGIGGSAGNPQAVGVIDLRPNPPSARDLEPVLQLISRRRMAGRTKAMGTTAARAMRLRQEDL
jgi:hypothetical protein